jgi:hypothetical protein
MNDDPARRLARHALVPPSSGWAALAASANPGWLSRQSRPASLLARKGI